MLSSSRHIYNAKNRQSIYRFIDELFEHHAKLLPVRVDLSYKTNKTVSSNHKYRLYNHAPHAYLTRDDILTNWTTLLNKLKWNHRTLLKELVGYIWKIEYGQDKGVC